MTTPGRDPQTGRFIKAGKDFATKSESPASYASTHASPMPSGLKGGKGMGEKGLALKGLKGALP